ncbi:aldehyde dehydrogenase [Nocardia flavorosea]|uniref:aldehyde dehydrogenase (NAD(+)) n=1 Tax=Nocardia flavorosea TaxID=53429 RepID=A0A846YND8_9NOCA|nr:aldehyde dehydrogenase [Nocardia flavorosea]NKY60585.1 aldehyde dehydrogenase [Nocardia flavorosea]
MTNNQAVVRSHDKLFIGGRWVDPATSSRIDVVSPMTEEKIATVPEAGSVDIDRAVDAARAAFDSGAWTTLSRKDRVAALNRVADEIEARLPEMISTFSSEVGAPLAVSEAFHAMAVQFWRRNAQLLQSYDFEDRRRWDQSAGTVVREPVGVVGAIIPWNGPVANASLKLSAALAAGCSVVVKPAREGPVSTFLLAEALAAAGLPEGLVSILPGDRPVGAHLVDHRGVDKVSFTGSTAAGKKIMQSCAARVARVTLELGGKSAAIITDDAVFEDVLPSLIPASVGHSGQVCAAVTRVLAPRSRYTEFVDVLGAALRGLRVGDPFAPDTILGPLVSERQRTRVENYIGIGREEGARVVTGGGRPQGMERGWFIEPTLFADVDNSMRIAREEIFGPVVVAIPYTDIEEAVAIANDSEYGLSGAVYSGDHEVGQKIARRIRTGQIFVNSAGLCLTEPFGGYKQSGLGREGGVEGIGAFLETKLIVENA